VVEVVWIVLKSKNRFLLIQRSVDDVAGGTWCFPGGKVDPDDKTPADAAARELKEETNIDGHNFKLLRKLRIGQCSTNIFLCNMWDGEIKPACEDIMGVGWFTVAEIHAIGQSLTPFLSECLMYVSYLLHQH